MLVTVGYVAKAQRTIQTKHSFTLQLFQKVTYEANQDSTYSSS